MDRGSGAVVFGLVLLALSLNIPASAQPAVGSPSLKGVDLDGQYHLLGDRTDTHAVVVTFLSTECPISNSYVPQLNDLSLKYRRKGIEVFGVISDPGVTRHKASVHQKQYKIRFPVLFDGSGELRMALSPTHTPHAFVLGRFGTKLYEGAIDNRYVALGRKKEKATERYLQDAVEAVVSGNPVPTAKTEPIGCAMEDPPNKLETGRVTYARDIAPIIQAHCTSCHRPGQSGPFSLLKYVNVSRHANQIVEVTRSRFMPPWKPEPGFTPFRGSQRLTDHELSLLEAWVKAGKPTGVAADLPAPVQYDDGWPLGEPDMVLKMEESFAIPASGPDIRRYFVIPAHLHEDRLITAIDFRPGAAQSVHHASFFLDSKRQGRRLDEADEGPGYAGFGGPRFQPDGTLSSWFPGMSPHKLPNGMGRLVTRGSDIVAEIHYVTTGKPERDRSSIGIYFAPRSARHLVVEMQIGNKDIEIPAGEKKHHERASYTLPAATELLDITPHMHMLGREIKVWARAPGGKVTPMLWIKDWDFNWQGQYAFAESVRLPKGTKIIVDAWFDNSSDNLLNPNSPPKTVRWGDDSTDEMLLCTFQCTCESMNELNELVSDQKRYITDAAK